MRFCTKKRLTKRKKGKKSKWGMPGAAQMEKIYRLKLCAKHEYTNRDRKRPNEKIKVEKFTLEVAYLNLCAASIDYQSTLFCMRIICSCLE